MDKIFLPPKYSTQTTIPSQFFWIGFSLAFFSGYLRILTKWNVLEYQLWCHSCRMTSEDHIDWWIQMGSVQIAFSGGQLLMTRYQPFGCKLQLLRLLVPYKGVIPSFKKIIPPDCSAFYRRRSPRVWELHYELIYFMVWHPGGLYYSYEALWKLQVIV